MPRAVTTVAFLALVGAASCGSPRIGDIDPDAGIDAGLICADPDRQCGGSCTPCPACDVFNINAEDAALDFAPAVSLDCAATVDTSLTGAAMLVEWCGPAPTPVVQTQTGGGEVVVLPMASFNLAAGQTLRLTGDKPVALAVDGDVTISGTIDAGGRGYNPGPGGDDPLDGAIATAGTAAGDDCAAGANGSGQGRNEDTRALGGGGAGFRTNGAFGGGERPNFRCYKQATGAECEPDCPDNSCDNSFIDSVNRHYSNNSTHYAATPIYGLAAADQSLTPLRAGCAGGKGHGSGSPWYGGAGGGALQISATGTMTVASGGNISVGGGGGRNGGDNEGGSGGGSGGSLLVEARTLALSAAGGLRAHGGSGAGRSCGANSRRAENGHVADNNHARHPNCSSDGRGGLAYWDVDSAVCRGEQDGDRSGCLVPPTNYPTSLGAYPFAGGVTDNNGGGGGGGAGGVIRVRLLAEPDSCF